MKAIVLLLTASLIFFSLGLQAFSCEPTLASEASPPSPNPESGVESPRPLIPNPLPRLSEAEIKALQAEVAQSIDLWFDLAGVSAMSPPPALTDELENYREAWSAVNPNVATFLGAWVYMDSAGSFYSVTVFPSRTPGQACVLEFIPESSLYIYNEVTGEYVKDILAEQLLTISVAMVQDGHLRSSQVRSVGSATVMANYAEDHPVAFMGLMDDQGTRRVVALASPPTLPSDLPEALVGPVSLTLSTYGCITDPVLPGE
ncbi:MAG TPA: hypothetical protein V6C78_31905 [Crinalium sp.]|jgi:hypothetical protein